jgi:hypothetical protein
MCAGLGIAIRAAPALRGIARTEVFPASAVLGSIIFAIGIVGAVGCIADVPTYVWQWRAPMSFLSTICASIGLTWTQAPVIRLMPMPIANGILPVVAARQVRRQALEGRSGLRDPRAAI